MIDVNLLFDNIIYVLLSVCNVLLLTTVCAKKEKEKGVNLHASADSGTPEKAANDYSPQKLDTEKKTSSASKENVTMTSVETQKKGSSESKESNRSKDVIVNINNNNRKSKEGEKKEKDEPKVVTKSKGKSKKDKSNRGDKKKFQIMRTEDTKQTEDKIDARREWALKVLQTKCSTLSKIHREKIKGYKPSKAKYTAFEANIALNRYADVYCVEETRVVLKNRKNDYIHASWVTIPDSDTKYILTQGPLPETIADFWAMCYQEKVKYILMLCPLVEGDIEKCSQYFPSKEGDKEQYGEMEVTFSKKEPEPVKDVGLSVMTVLDTEKADSKPMDINHVFVPWWPDQLAPEDPKPMLELYRWVKKANTDNSPIVVHCSAGVGRTATFVGIDYANIRIQQEPDIDMVDIAHELRNMRFQAIQSHVQYLFLHVCLLEYFAQEGLIERENFGPFLEEYRKHATKKLQKRKAEDPK